METIISNKTQIPSLPKVPPGEYSVHEPVRDISDTPRTDKLAGDVRPNGPAQDRKEKHKMKKYTLTEKGPQAHTTKGTFIAIVPVEVAENQKEYDGKTFPILLVPTYQNRTRFNSSPRKARGTLRGDLYGLNTSGTGDMIVSVGNRKGV